MGYYIFKARLDVAEDFVKVADFVPGIDILVASLTTLQLPVILQSDAPNARVPNAKISHQPCDFIIL